MASLRYFFFCGVLFILCSSSLFAASPSNIKAAAPTAPASNTSPAASSRKVKVWVVNQSSNWGKSTVKACDEGIRIEASTGAILVAKAPTWEVVIFRKGQKQASKNSFAKFITKYPHNISPEKVRARKYNVKVAGAPAVTYAMPINKRLDASDGFGQTFQSKVETPFVTNQYSTYAANSIKLPDKVKEIWRTYFEFPFINCIPLEYYLELADGSKRYSFETHSQKYADLLMSEFDHPSGLTYSAEFMQMIYGKKMEDVADLLMSP